jgi:undecaprenyl-diphosphatase
VTAAPTLSEQTALPTPLRRPAAVTAVAATAVLAVLAVRYAGGTSPRWFDVRAESVVAAVLGRSLSWRMLLSLGNLPQVVVVAVVLAAVAQVFGRHRLAVLAIVGPGLTGAATSALKPLVGRMIRRDFAYPSGHAGAATAFGLVAALLLISVLQLGRASAALLLAAGALLAGGAMAAALIVCDWHYPTDTIGGFCTAVAVVLGTAVLIDRASRWRAEKACRALEESRSPKPPTSVVRPPRVDGPGRPPQAAS